MIRQSISGAALLLMAACGENTAANTETPVTKLVEDEAPQMELAEPVEPEVLSPEQQAITNAKLNIAALTAYRDYAEAYKAETGSYPLTKRNFRSAVGAFEDAAEADLPEGEKADLGLPEGAKLSKSGGIVYRSDGTDFKLIAQRTGDCSVVQGTDPDLIDPKREYGPGDCIAYGFWTSGAETW